MQPHDKSMQKSNFASRPAASLHRQMHSTNREQSPDFHGRQESQSASQHTDQVHTNMHLQDIVVQRHRMPSHERISGALLVRRDRQYPFSSVSFHGIERQQMQGENVNTQGLQTEPRQATLNHPRQGQPHYDAVERQSALRNVFSSHFSVVLQHRYYPHLQEQTQRLTCDELPPHPRPPNEMQSQYLPGKQSSVVHETKQHQSSEQLSQSRGALPTQPQTLQQDSDTVRICCPAVSTQGNCLCRPSQQADAHTLRYFERESKSISLVDG